MRSGNVTIVGANNNATVIAADIAAGMVSGDGAELVLLLVLLLGLHSLIE